jgi:rRNA-processing protein FCF1
MDADCLIKLTKAKLKELVCKNFTVIIPQTVKKEVVDNAQGHPDAITLRENLKKDLLTVNKLRSSSKKGEDAIFTIYKSGKFDAICSDDKRFIKRLQLFDIPYITSSVFIAILWRTTIKEARKKLDSLSPFISDDEYNAIKLILGNWSVQ